MLNSGFVSSAASGSRKSSTFWLASSREDSFFLARFMHAVFLGQPGRNLDHIEEAPWVMRAPMLLMAFMVILTGVFPGLMLAPLNAALAEYGMPSLRASTSCRSSSPKKCISISGSFSAYAPQ